MNDEPPEIFDRVTPRGAPAELRARVLAVVDRQLADQLDASDDPVSCATAGLSSSACRAPAGPRWERIVEIVVAASLLLGVGMNVWQQRADEAWQARVFGPPPVPRAIADLAQAVASVTDAQTGQWVQQRLSDSRPTRPPTDPQRNERYEPLLHGLTDFKTDRTL